MAGHLSLWLVIHLPTGAVYGPNFHQQKCVFSFESKWNEHGKWISQEIKMEQKEKWKTPYGQPRKKKNPPGVLLYGTIMVLYMEQLFNVSMQQLACKLCGRHPVKWFAFLSTTCPVCAMLTYLLEEYELALEIIPQCILSSAVRVKLL